MAFKGGVLVGNGDLATGQITANAQTVVVDVSSVGNVVAAASGTFAGVNVTFEVSIDGTTWYGIQMTRSNASVLETTSGALSATPGYHWEASVNGVNWFRVRSTAFTSGTQNWMILGGMFATEPAPVVGIAGTVATTQSGTWTNTNPTGTGYTLTTAASTNAASVKSSAGSLYHLSISNPTATAIYVKLYNKASAPTVGTDVPVMTVPVAAGATVTPTLGCIGARFATGIAIAATAAAASTDTAVAVAGVQVHATYI